jgi:hypothetical protein
MVDSSYEVPGRERPLISTNFSSYPISMQTLEIVLLTLNLLSAAIAWCYSPQAVLTGGFLGAVARRFICDNAYSFEISEAKRRSNRIAHINFSLIAATYSAFTYNTAIRSSPAKFPFAGPFIIGFDASLNGIYPLARKLTG